MSKIEVRWSIWDAYFHAIRHFQNSRGTSTRKINQMQQYKCLKIKLQSFIIRYQSMYHSYPVFKWLYMCFIVRYYSTIIMVYFKSDPILLAKLIIATHDVKQVGGRVLLTALWGHYKPKIDLSVKWKIPKLCIYVAVSWSYIWYGFTL